MGVAGRAAETQAGTVLLRMAVRPPGNLGTAMATERPTAVVAVALVLPIDHVVGLGRRFGPVATVPWTSGLPLQGRPTGVSL